MYEKNNVFDSFDLSFLEAHKEPPHVELGFGDRQTVHKGS
jgi:hypothetical protein